MMLVAGVVLLVAVLLDVAWTTLSTHGGGLISSRFVKGSWALARAIHRRLHSHRFLSLASVGILAGVVVLWVALLWIAWLLIFSIEATSVVGTSSGEPAGLWERVYFTGYTLFTLGNGELKPAGASWQIATTGMAATGLAVLTLALTYLLSVLSAAVEKKSLGAMISAMGSTPHALVVSSWNGSSFPSLDAQFALLGSSVHLYAQRHLAYPVLHVMHSQSAASAATVRTAALFDALLLFLYGVAEHARPDPPRVAPLRNALTLLAETVGPFTRDPGREPPAPELGRLREAGIPTVTDAEFRARIEPEQQTRRFFLSLVIDDGYAWSDVTGAPAEEPAGR